MMSTVRESILISVFIGALAAPATWGQQQSPDQPAAPIPAIHSPLASAADNGEADDTADNLQKLVPDNRPLAGVQDLSLGAPATSHSYWQPHFDISTTVDSNPLSSTGSNGWTTWTSFIGGVDLHRDSGNFAMMLNYVGGDSISNSGNYSNGIVQGLNFSDRIAFRRFAVSFFDELMYAPQTALGSAGIPGAPTLPGGGSIGLGGGYTPGQSILTTRGQRITNSSFVELDNYLSPRSSLTFVGGYSLLDNVDDSLLNYGSIYFTAGYNHQMSRRDTIALSYQFSSFNYSNYNQFIKNNIISISYGRRITGKLAFQISGGPDIAFLHTPITTAGTTGGSGSTSTSSTTQVYGSLNAALQYQMRRVALSAAYWHGVNPGSGVLAGSVADTVTGTASRRLSRTFSGSWNFGYSRNRGLAVNGTTTSNQTYSYWFTGANLSHAWGRSMNVFLNYQLQYQNSNASFCVDTSCGTNVTRNQISFGLGWHKQPSPF